MILSTGQVLCRCIPSKAANKNTEMLKLSNWAAMFQIILGVLAMASAFTVGLSKSVNENHKVHHGPTPVKNGGIVEGEVNATNIETETSINEDHKVQKNSTLVSASRAHEIPHWWWMASTGVTGGTGLVALITALSTFCWLG